MNLVDRLLNDEQAATMTEYAMLLALVSLGMVSAMSVFSDEIIAVFKGSASALSGIK